MKYFIELIVFISANILNKMLIKSSYKRKFYIEKVKINYIKNEIKLSAQKFKSKLNLEILSLKHCYFG